MSRNLNQIKVLQSASQDMRPVLIKYINNLTFICIIKDRFFYTAIISFELLPRAESREYRGLIRDDTFFKNTQRLDIITLSQ